MFFRGFKYYLVSYLRGSDYRNPELVKYYIRGVLATGYGTYNFIKYFKGSGVPRARIINIKSRRKRREHRSRKIEKRRRKEEIFYFPKPKNREDLVRFSVR